MSNLGLILLVFAFVIACISIIVPVVRTWSLLSLAIALWIAAEIFGGATKLFR